TGRLVAAGIQMSMDGRGRALDNIFVERLWRTIKYEEVYLKDYGTPREAIRGLDEFFQLYNRQRPHQALGYLTPATVYFGSYIWQTILICVSNCLDNGVHLKQIPQVRVYQSNDFYCSADLKDLSPELSAQGISV